MVEDNAGVNAGVVGVVTGTSGDKALSDAPEAILRKDCVSVVGVGVMSSIALVLTVSGSK